MYFLLDTEAFIKLAAYVRFRLIGSWSFQSRTTLRMSPARAA